MCGVGENGKYIEVFCVFGIRLGAQEKIGGVRGIIQKRPELAVGVAFGENDEIDAVGGGTVGEDGGKNRRRAGWDQEPPKQQPPQDGDGRSSNSLRSGPD